MAMSALTETTGGSLVGSRLPRKRIKSNLFAGKGMVLARGQSNGYELRIEEGAPSHGRSDLLYDRRGTMILRRLSDGKEVQAGYWMGIPETGRGQTISTPEIEIRNQIEMYGGLRQLWESHAGRAGIKASPFVTRYPVKGFPTVQDAGRWLADQWSKLESRYGRTAAIGMVTAMLATMPLPGNVAAVIAAAEAVRGLHGVLAGKALHQMDKVRCHQCGTVQSLWLPSGDYSFHCSKCDAALTDNDKIKSTSEYRVKSSPFRSRPPLGKSLTPDAVAKMLEK